MIVRSIGRRQLLIFTSCALLGCAPKLTHIDAQSSVSGIDFRPHTRDGFLFSPNPFIAEHTVIGMVTVEMRAEMNLVPSPSGYTKWIATPIPVDSILARAKRRVVELGGDALVNFSIRGTSELQSAYLTIPGIEVSGLAIRRITR